MSEAVDAAGARLETAAARLVALRERAARLDSGVPVSLSDVMTARAWAEAQETEAQEAARRLDSAHLASARRHRAAAALAEAAGHLERAEGLRVAARRQERARRDSRGAVDEPVACGDVGAGAEAVPPTAIASRP